MSLQNKEEHNSCRFYANEFTALFRYLKLQAGETVTVDTKDESVLIYLESGSLEAVLGGLDAENISKKNLLFIPMGVAFHGRCNNDVKLCTCRFSLQIPLCTRYDLLDLQEDIKNMNGGKLPPFPRKFPQLAANEKLESFFSTLESYLEDGLDCTNFHDIKRKELMTLLRAYYTKEELYDLFFPVVGKDSSFREFVIRSYKEVSNIEDFAAHANMTLRSFQRRFKSEFGCSARDWLLARRAESIIATLRDTNRSFSDIAIEHGFSTTSYFTNFCKNQLGMTPSEIRGRRCMPIVGGAE